MIEKQQLDTLWGNLQALGPRRLAVFGIVGLVVMGLVGLAATYLRKPPMQMIYSGLSAQDVTRMGAVLGEAGIEFDVNAKGTGVLVRYGKIARARMLLAEKGLPSGGSAGYELFDNMGSIGLTSFMQEVTRVRALEGEIARTIQAMNGVRAARVHLVMSTPGTFRRSRQAPSASVVLRTDGDRGVGMAQAIRHMVAAAVPGLVVDGVTILSTEGQLLASGSDRLTMAVDKTMSLEKSVAEALREKARTTLAPYLGLDNFQVSVAAKLNTDKQQIKATEFDPESRVERSVRVVKENGLTQNNGGSQAVSVEQNIPEEEAQAQSGDASLRKNDRREELTNFEVNSTVKSTVREGYRIETLNIAVVVNRARLLAVSGEGATDSQTQERLKEIEHLVGAATGLNTKRGDRLVVTAVNFADRAQVLSPVPGLGAGEHLLRQTGALINAIAILAVTFVVIWFGVRPATRALMEVPPVQSGAALALDGSEGAASRDIASQQVGQGGVLAAPGSPGAGQSTTAPNVAGRNEPNLIEDLQQGRDRTPEKRLEQIIELDEEQAVAVMKHWMQEAS